MAKRTKPPSEMVTDVLAASRRRCCLCFALRGDDTEKRGQIAHLDHDPSNNSVDNLAFLCLEHHDQYDSRTSQSKSLTIDEVKRYRIELHVHVARSIPWSDSEILTALMPALDRPAFRTRFSDESSLPRFREAIAETIKTLNTGRTPQGAQLPSKFQLQDASLRAGVDKVIEALVALRARFDRLVRDGEIKHCGCGKADCPIFFFSEFAAHEMDDARSNLLALGHALHSSVPDDFYSFT